MAVVVELPRLSDTMEEGVVARWLIKEGDKVKRGQVIAEIETDKATMEFESFDSGTVLKLLVAEGSTLALGAPIAVFGAPGDDVDAVLANHGGAGSAAASAAAAAPAPAPVTAPAPPAAAPAPSVAAAAAAPAPEADRVDQEPVPLRIAASPLARKIAREHGVDLRDVDGSGPRGRVIKQDIDRALASGSSKASARAAAATTLSTDADSYGRPYASRSDTSFPLSQMRKTIVKRMVQSKREAPHFYLTIDVHMDAAAALRSQLNEVISDAKVSFNDLVIAASAKALREHPRVNATYTEQGIIEHGDIHVGMAVAIEDGLLVPVVRHAEQKSLRAISKETRSLGGKAKDKTLRPEEMSGSTFTVSNLGMFGIEEFAAVVNPGEGAILAVGSVREVPVFVSGKLEAHKRMKCTLSCDHRVVDGAVGARFLQTLQGYLEQPMRLFAD